MSCPSLKGGQIAGEQWSDKYEWRTADDGSEIDYSWTVIEWFEVSSTPTQEMK